MRPRSDPYPLRTETMDEGLWHLPDRHLTTGRALAAAQTAPQRGNVDANIAQHLELAHVAANENVRLIVFPELSLTGYELDLALTLAFSERDPRLTPLVESAASHEMTIVVGAPVRLASRLHIGAFIISPLRIIELYTKHHLGTGEDTVMHPGNLNPLVRVGQRVGAVAVCADANHPSHPAEAARLGARDYLVSTFITPQQLETKTAALRAYAKQHAMTVVFANYGGPSGGLPGGGGSAIWTDHGEPVALLEGTGAGLAIAIENDDGWRGMTMRLDGI